MANVAVRNTLSVGLPTAIREVFRRAVFEVVSDTAKLGLGGAAILMPVVLELVGAYRDSQNGTATATTTASRIAKSALVLGTTFAAVATGTFATAGPTLAAATFVYAPLRDVTQYFLQLRDNNPDCINAAATSWSAGLYGINQTVISQAMATLVTAFEPEMGEVAANATARAIVNVIGETLDEFTNRGLTNYFTGRTLGSLDITLGRRSSDQVNVSTAADQAQFECRPQRSVRDGIFHSVRGAVATRLAKQRRRSCTACSRLHPVHLRPRSASLVAGRGCAQSACRACASGSTR